MFFVDFIWFPEQSTYCSWRCLCGVSPLKKRWKLKHFNVQTLPVTSATITGFSQHNCSWQPFQLMVDVEQNVLWEVIESRFEEHITLCSQFRIQLRRNTVKLQLLWLKGAETINLILNNNRVKWMSSQQYPHSIKQFTHLVNQHGEELKMWTAYNTGWPRCILVTYTGILCIACFVSSVYCLCVNVYCTAATMCQPNCSVTNTSYIIYQTCFEHKISKICTNAALVQSFNFLCKLDQ